MSPDGAHLRGSPLIHDTKASDGIVPIAAAGPKTYSGAIDTPNQPVIFGWAVGSDLTEASVVVRINDGDAITIPANLPRSDLIAKQLTRSGGGWRIVAADMLAPGTNRISITFPDGAHLPGSPFERTLEGGTPVAAPVRSPPPAPTPAVSPFGRAKRPSPEDAAAPSAPAPVAAVQTHAQALAPFSKPAQPPAAAPAPSNVRPFPARTGKGGMPSLPELDELSLDDLSHAIAAGIIDVAPPPAPEPVPDPMAEESDGAVNKAQRSQNRAGFLARLFGRG